jgi:hypothetical protein
MLFLLGATFARSQSWAPLLRDAYQVEVDAPAGVTLLTDPSPDAKVIEIVPGPLTFKVCRYLDFGAERYYLTTDEFEAVMTGRPAAWIRLPHSKRGEFIAGTTPAKLMKRETRDFFKEGPQTAEVYEETVNLVPRIEWPGEFRRSEVDFRLPVKVTSFRTEGSDAWEMELAVFPAFESNEDRIPGPAPEFSGDPYRDLITRPVQRGVTIHGTRGAQKLAGLFLPGTVWSAECFEGRIQSLRIGWHDIQPPREVSRLSAPHFRRGETMSFRFRLNRLSAEPAEIEVTPDRIIGVDWTNYDAIAKVGGEPGEYSDAQQERYLQTIWNVKVTADLLVAVVTPVIEGRGAAGSLELESLGLGPSFEEELKALSAMAKATAPPLDPPADPSWLSVIDHELGVIPMEQRITEPADFR